MIAEALGFQQPGYSLESYLTSFDLGKGLVITNLQTFIPKKAST